MFASGNQSPQLTKVQKVNIGGTKEENDLINQLFPFERSKLFEDQFMEMFEKLYDPKKHEQYLIINTYKTAYASIQHIYMTFSREFYPKLQQPPISSYYSNDCFIYMSEMTDWFMKMEYKQEDYPSVQKQANPKEIFYHLSILHSQINYTPHLQRFLLLYPDYFVKFCTHREKLFYHNDVNIQEAYMLCILTAIEMACPYMIARSTIMFLVSKGKQEWITKNSYPPQLQHLLTMIRKIAKTPWDINEQDFMYLQKEHGYNIKRLFFWFQIIIWAVTACTISLALGLQPEQPCPLFDMKALLNVKKEYDDIKYESLENKKEMYDQIYSKYEAHPQMTSKEVQQHQKRQIQPYMKAIGKEMDEQKLYESFNQLTNFLTGKFCKTQKRTDDRRKESQDNDNSDKFVKKIMCENLDCKCGQTFWDLIGFSLNMTYANFGTKKTDTKKFRQSIQYYAEVLLGVIHKGYSYKQNIKMNLSMPLRFYVRLLANNPAYIKRQTLQQIKHQSKHIELFDLGHLALLVADTKARVIATQICRHIIL